MKRKPALFSPGWLEETSADPERASKEIQRIAVERERLQSENTNVRQERDQLRREAERCDMAFRGIQIELENERRVARASKAARVDAERQLSEHTQLLEKTTRSAERRLNKEKDRTACLERRVHTLEQFVFKARAQRDAGRIASAIQKLAASPAVGRRLAAACHPDKVPAEYSDLADQLFKFVQNVRDSSSS